MPARFLLIAAQLAAAAAASAVPPPAGAPAACEDAFKALDVLSATLPSVLSREKYAEELRRSLPRVMTCVGREPGELSHDARSELNAAAHLYQSAVRIDAWPRVDPILGSARARVAYAASLAARDAPDHQESPAPRRLAPGQTVEGRIGYGDAPLPVAWRPRGSVDDLSDVYEIELKAPLKAEFEVNGGPCPLALVLEDVASGKKLADKASSGTLSLAKGLKPGRYRLWVAGVDGIGVYELTFR